MKSKIEQEFMREQIEPVRLNKFISDAGYCSRREADRLIDQGRVKVDGKQAEKGMKVSPGQSVMVGKKQLAKAEKMVLLAVNKPVGIVCTAEKREKKNIVDFMKYPQRIYPVGRLDKDSEGLILMTNNGEIVNKIMRGGNFHEKEYLVKVDKPITEQFLSALRHGVPILDTVSRPCQAEKIGTYTFRITLTQGLNRQIRRMCEYLGYKVLKLKRERIMNIQLGNLKPGSYRELTTEELNKLYEGIKKSSNETAGKYKQ